MGKPSPAAAIRIAVDMTRQPGWSITREEALARVTDEQLHHVLEGAGGGSDGAVLGQGLGASPGVATGRAYFTADGCMKAADRGEDVVLVRRETSPEDVHGMQVAKGILTTHGGLVSHAAVVAREWGIPAVVGLAAASATEDALTIGPTRVREGDVITIDGESGRVYQGEVAGRRPDLAPEVAEFLSRRETQSPDRSRLPSQ